MRNQYIIIQFNSIFHIALLKNQHAILFFMIIVFFLLIMTGKISTCRYVGSKMLRPLLQNSNWNSNKSHEVSVVTAGNCFQYAGSIKMENMTTAVMAQYEQLGLSADNVFHHMLTPKSNCQKESSPFPSSSSSQSNPESHNSEHHHICCYDANYSFHNQNVTEKTDLDHTVHDSPSADQGFGNDFCHASNHINSGGNVGKAISNAVTKNSRTSSDGRRYNHSNYDYDCDDDEEFRLSDSHRSSQREAALTKFRLKRKERCFEKKVL